MQIIIILNYHFTLNIFYQGGRNHFTNYRHIFSPPMDSMDIAFLEQDADFLKAYSDQNLSQIQVLSRSCYLELPASSHHGELNFEQLLHIEMLIDGTRQKLLNCNLALAEYIIICYNPHQQQIISTFNKGISKAISEKNIKKEEKTAEEDIGCLEVGGKKGVNDKKQKQKWSIELRTLLQSFKKVLTIRQVQLTMVLFILQHRQSQKFGSLYLKNFGQIIQFMIPLQDSTKPINIFILQDLFKKQLEYLSNYAAEISQLSSYSEYLSSQGLDKSIQMEVNNIISKIKIANAKIRTISEIFPQACVKDLEDLFSYDMTHPRWQWLFENEYITYVFLDDQASLQKSFGQINENLNVINATMNIMDQNHFDKNKPLNQNLKNMIEASVKILKCAIFKSQAHFQAEIMISEPRDMLAKQIWNLPENKRFRDLIEFSLPSIQYSEVLYLPRIFKTYFLSKYWEGIQTEMPDLIIGHGTAYGDELYHKKPYSDSIRIRINSHVRLQRKYYTLTTEELAALNEQKSRSMFYNLSSNFSTLIKGMASLFKQSHKMPKQVIFHIHGGGFISMSSFIHQTYTRIWANNIKVPVVSVDYGKAPDRPFPQGLYDCLEAYLWTLLIFKQIYEISPERIVLVGDSAGGNLVAALTTLLIEWKLPLPTGIVLVYPALNLNTGDYTPSLLTALNDMIIPHTFLKICAKAYLQNCNGPTNGNALINPIFTCDETLKKYPETHIFVGNKDPFHDDCCRFVERINKLNKDRARLTVFDEFPHGFLQFDLKFMPNQYSRKATKQVEQALTQLLQQK